MAARTLVTANPTGEAEYAIPIDFPDARYKPDLAIVYSSRSPDDRHFGTGWRLNLPTIDDNRVPRTLDPYLSPDGPLRVENAAANPNLFVAAEDHTGHRRQYLRTGDDWTVTGKTGEVWTYSKHLPGTQSLAFPSMAALLHQENAVGDYINYAYASDGRVQQIRYGGNVDGEPVDVVVNFEYEARACRRTSFRTVPASVHNSRLAKIHVRVRGVEEATWAFEYDDCPDRLVSVVRDRVALPSAFVPVPNPQDEDQTWTFDYAATPAYRLLSLGEDAFVMADALDEIDPDRVSPLMIAFSRSIGDRDLRTVRAPGSLNGDALPDLLQPEGASNSPIETYVGELLRATPQVIYDLSAGTEYDFLDVRYGSRLPGLGFTMEWPNREFLSLPGIFPVRNERSESRIAIDVDGDGFTDVISLHADEDGLVDRFVDIAWGARADFGFVTTIELPASVNALSNTLYGGRIPLLGRIHNWTLQETDLLDWNADGYVDIVRARPEEAALDIFLWNPDLGSWAFDRSYAAPWCAEAAWQDDIQLCGLRLSGAGELNGGATQQYAGLLDMNGDGLVDFVRVPDFFPSTSLLQPLPWQVYLNTGRGGFQTQSVAWGDTDTLMPPAMLRQEAISDYDGGRYLLNQRRQTVMRTGDVNGDGLIDIIDVLDSTWFENTGDAVSGFIERPLPSLWDPLDTVDDYEMTTGGHGYVTRSMVTDWNGDGALDLLDVGDPDGPTLYASTPSAYLLRSVATDASRATLSWKSSAEAYPSGTPQLGLYNGSPYTSHVAVAALSRVFNVDLVTNKSTTTRYTWQYPTWDPLRRRLVGFRIRIAEDADHRATTSWYTEQGFTGLEAFHATEDPNGGTEFVLVRSSGYDTMDIMGCSPTGTCVVVPTGQVVEEHRGPVSRERAVEFEYDLDANIVGVHNIGDSRAEDEETAVEIEYTTPGRNGLVRACVIRRGAWNPHAQPSLDTLVVTNIEYDGLPLCEIDAGHVSASEILGPDSSSEAPDPEGGGTPTPIRSRRTEYLTSPYGQIETTTLPSGARYDAFYDDDFRYVERRTNPLGQPSFATVDLWGQTTAMRGVDGVSQSFQFDGRGRPSRAWNASRIPDVGPPVSISVLRNRVAYVDGAAPSVTSETLAASQVDARAVAFLDGWGATVQNREEQPSGA